MSRPADGTGPATILRLALDVPLHGCFDYVASDPRVEPGDWVRVPFGSGEQVALVLEVADTTALSEERLKPAGACTPWAPRLQSEWLALIRFAARYYHAPIGQVALGAIPAYLRRPELHAPVESDALLRRRLRAWALPPPDTGRRPRAKVASNAPVAQTPPEPIAALTPLAPPALTTEQAAVLDALLAARQQHAVHVLHGITGSGKTELYLRLAQTVLDDQPCHQVLFLVPEIALTPQLLQRVQARFPTERIAVLHSEVPDAERAHAWLAATRGEARIVLGTRLAVMVPLLHPALLIVDEEHDPSFKQQESLRYHARDLAIWRAHHNGVPVVLGSATPSLETWHKAQTGRYRMHRLTQRATAQGRLPAVRTIDMRAHEAGDGLSAPLREAIAQRLAQGEQSLIFHNRRGYAPVLACTRCGWVSNCRRCSAFSVFHRALSGQGGTRLVCHHCGDNQRVPRACPGCGNLDLQALGRGTQRVEEALAVAFPSARVLRLDRDVASGRRAAEQVLEQVHRGETDILVGTQMLAKGHDFEHITLVGVVNPDPALFSGDFRASERLFATLTQVAGRAGRARSGAEVLIQTRYPDHPLFDAIARHDFAGYADLLLEERAQAGLPPYGHQAILRADASRLEDALGWLQTAAALADTLPDAATVQRSDPVPMALVRLARRERAQLLVESASRPALQAFLDDWLDALRSQRTRVRWQLEVDPIEV